MEFSENRKQLLQNVLHYAALNSAYYKQLFYEKGIEVSDITIYSDLQKIPTTDKETVQRLSDQFVCIHKQDVAEYTSTSGTLGMPLSVPLSNRDLERLARNEYLSFEKMQIDANDVVQLMLTLDRQFMAGMAYYNGIRKTNASIVRIGPGLPQLQWDAINRYRSTVLVAVPSFLLKLITYAQQNGIDYLNSSVKKVLAIGESLTNAKLQPTVLSQQLKALWPTIEIYNTYAATELQTAFTDCELHNGMHEHESLIITEIVDETGKQLNAGELGEICITTLGIEGMPLIRYRTGDMSIAYTEQCACGNNGIRIGGIEGRKNHLLKVKGTTLYPNTIINALNEHLSVQSFFINTYSNASNLDEVEIFLSLTDNTFIDAVVSFLHAKLKFKPNVILKSLDEVASMQFTPLNRKQTYFTDSRIR